ncbi:Calx-beta domain-containing protein, partial [Microcoleus sp. C2C3]
GSNPSIVTINDVPPPTPTLPSLFEFDQQNYTVAEGSTVTINVIRTGGTEAASINYSTVDGSATSGGTAGDYTSATGVLSFDAGQTTASFTVTALSDMTLEDPETVNLVLFGGEVGSNPSILTINDVPPPTPTLPSLFEFAQPNYTVAEGDVVTINVNRTGGTEAASINYSTVDGSATSGGTAGDYTSATGVLSFDAGQTTASFTVTALSDMTLEDPETVNLVLFGGEVGSNPSILTINDVPPPLDTTSPSIFQFAQPTYTVAEGDVATINVTRTGGLAAASINYQTLNGSANSAGTAADYTPAAGVLNFLAGQSTASFSVTTSIDTRPESPETVVLVLGGGNVGGPPSFLTINDVSSTGTPPTPMISPQLFQFAQANYIDPSFAAPTSFFYGSSPDPIIDGGYGVVTTNRTANTSVPPSVDYLIAAPGGGQPVNNVDSTIVSSFPVSPTGDTVNFNPGQTRVSRTINNPLGLTSGPVNLGFGPGANVGNQPNTQITLI